MADVTDIGVLLTFKLVDQITGKLNKIDRKIKGMGDNSNNIFAKMRGGMMGIGFAALFMGAQMNKFLTGFINNAINSYKIMGTENSLFTQKTNELRAAWEFFKFSLIDALNQSELFVTLIDFVIGLVEWFGRLSEGEKQMILLGIAVGAVSTKILSLSGNVLLLFASLAAMGVAGLILGAVLAVIVIVLFEIALAWVVLKKYPEEARRIWNYFTTEVIDKLKKLKERFEEVTGITLPNMSSIWNFVATNIIVGIKMMVIGLGKLVDMLVLTIDAFDILKKIGLAAFYATSGQIGKAQAALSGFSTSLSNLNNDMLDFYNIGQDLDFLFNRGNYAPDLLGSSDQVDLKESSQSPDTNSETSILNSLVQVLKETFGFDNLSEAIRMGFDSSNIVVNLNLDQTVNSVTR